MSNYSKRKNEQVGLSLTRARQARRELDQKNETDNGNAIICTYRLQSSFASMNLNMSNTTSQYMSATPTPHSPPKVVHRFLPGSENNAGVFIKLILNKGDDSENVIDNCKRKATHITYILSYLSGKSDNPESTAVTPTRSNRNKRKKVSWSNKDEFINNDNNSNDRDTKMGDNKEKIDTHPRFLEPIEDLRDQ